MKINKFLAGMTASAMALSLMATAASAADADPDPDVPEEPDVNVTVLHDGPINLTELSPEQLGKGIEGAKLRFTFTSATEDVEAGYGVLGIAGINYDWEWVQSENDPAFVTSGPGETDTVEISYTDFVALADIGDNLRCFVFQDWGLAPESDCLIELITPVEHNAEMTLYNAPLVANQDLEISPEELGKDIPGAKIQFTYTSATEKNWGAVGLAGKAAGTWDWEEAGMSFVSDGVDTTTTLTYTYADFVAYAGIGDDLECFVFQNWGLKEDTNFTVKLLIPADPDSDVATVTLFTGDLTLDGVAFTPVQLGSTVEGSQIKITYTGADAEGEAAVGICAQDGENWYTGVNCLASIGAGDENTYITTYPEFVEFVGITEPVAEYVFQNWGLEDDTTTTIELVLPVVTTAE